MEEQFPSLVKYVWVLTLMRRMLNGSDLTSQMAQQTRRRREDCGCACAAGIVLSEEVNMAVLGLFVERLGQLVGH